MNLFCCVTEANKLKEYLLEACWACDCSHEETNEQLVKYRFPVLSQSQYVEHFEYLDRINQ